MDRRFVESPKFPVDDVNLASAKEKSGGGRPKFWEMVFWWTRKPLASARAVIAGALLPENVDVFRFKSNLKLINGVCHRFNPTIPSDWKKHFEGKKLLDPFAGFGSIPLEGLRLGLDVTAVELLPVAYVFLKAVLEYPKKYGRRLVHDVEKWGKWITEQLRNDPDIKELYDSDVAVYIGSWEIKCPHCHKWTPLIGNWWLARVKKTSEESGEENVSKGMFSRIAWMTYKPEGERIKIKIIDLNEKLKLKQIRAKINTKEGTIIVGSDQYSVPKPNIKAKNEVAICLHCGNLIKYIDVNTSKHYINIKKMPQERKKTIKWYVKYALEQYHQDGLEIAKPRILAKVILNKKTVKFRPATAEDNDKLLAAKKKLEKMINDPDIPKEPLAPYGTQAIGGYLQPINYNMSKWYKLFNPRQLMALIKLVKLIRKAGEKIELEKIKAGWNKQEAFKYAEAVTVYLAIALCNCIDFNSLNTYWEVVWCTNKRTMAFRGVAMTWNWCDINLIIETTGSWIRCLNNVINGLKYLISISSDHSNAVQVVIDDATLLNKLRNNKFDIIITDPPYYDDVPYTELSDFYFVWLKRALSDASNGRLVPKFIPEAFFKRIGAKWVEVKTQWMEEDIVKREVSLNPPRIGANLENGKKYFLELLSRSFKVMSTLLIDDGVLVTYYAHTDPNAWEALLKAGWYAGRLKVTNAFPLITESAQRIIARSKVALDTSIIVVWRKGLSGVGDADEIYRKALKIASDQALELVRAGRFGADLFIGTMSSVLSSYTSFEKVSSRRGRLEVSELVKEYVYPATAVAIARALGRLAGGKGLRVSGEVKSSVGLFYLLCKALFVRSPRARRRVVDRSSFVMLAIGTRAYEKYLRDSRLVVKRDSRIYLMEPMGSDKSSVEDLLKDRGISVVDPVLNNSVDALHLLEYYAITLPREAYKEKLEWLRGEYPAFVEEALIIVGILAEILPKGDPEKYLCIEVLERSGLKEEKRGEQTTLTEFISNK